jgi:hypothetical protein
MNIQYFTRNVYGQTLLYVVGAEGAAIQTLTGKKTVTRGDLAALEALGHTTERVLEDYCQALGGVNNAS